MRSNKLYIMVNKASKKTSMKYNMIVHDILLDGI
jgi:hypothetical protein